MLLISFLTLVGNMVRNYKRKTNRGGEYSLQDLDKATVEVKSGRLTLRAASRAFNIPITSLFNYIKGYRKAKSSTQGRSTALPQKDETILASCIKTLEKWGFGLSRNEVLEIVGKYVRRNNIETPFKNGTPGEDWFLKFKARHGLSLKKPQSVEFARKKALDPFLINEYFDHLHEVITQNSFEDKPFAIYNLDETSFCVDPSKTKVVGMKNHPSTRTTSGPGKENKTVLFCSSASGQKLPPMIIYKGKYMWDEWMAPENQCFPNTAYAATQNGWMEAEVFLNYMTNTFLPNIVKERPVMLIYDGHSTHVDERVIKLANDNDIIILKLPPHSSHLLQPLDLSVFKSLKSNWDAKLVTWQRSHIGQKLSKKEFSIMIGNIWQELDPQVIQNGFRKGGIVPFNREIIPADKYDLLAFQRWEDHQKLQNPQLISNSSNGSETHTPTPSTSRIDFIPNSNLTETSFEALLLSEIKQKDKDVKQTKKRICRGAEVITASKRHCESENNDDTSQAESFNENKNRIATKKKAHRLSTSEESEINFESDKSDLGTLEDLVLEYEAEEQILKGVKDVAEKEVGNWVLVEFATKKKKLHYVGQILVINNPDDEATVNFLRKKKSTSINSTFFIWPDIKDESIITNESIVCILPEPKNRRRGELCFPISFWSYNVE